MKLFLAFLLVTTASAAEQPRKFWTKAEVISLSVGAAMMTADLVSTKMALERPDTHEANPLLSSPGKAVALKLGLFGASVGLSYALHRSHHDRAARILPIVFGLPSMAGAIHNFGVR